MTFLALTVFDPSFARKPSTVTKSPTLSQEKIQEMQVNIDEKKKRGTRELEDLQAEYQKTLETAIKPVREKLSQFMNNYATQRGIVMIIDLPVSYQNGVLAYWNPTTDLTEDFITEYNKANPVPGGAPASAPKTPAKPQR